VGYTIVFTSTYKKRAKKFALRHPEIKEQYRKTLKLLSAKPNHPALRLHQLKGKLNGLYSISINTSYRITLEFLISEKEIILVNVGTHDQAYRN